MPPQTDFRVALPTSVGELMRLALMNNPFLAREDIVDREVISGRIGLLVAERSATTTLLYLWTHPIDDLSPWMEHVSGWFERYADWRTAYELDPPSATVRAILASPAVEPKVRRALNLVSCPVTLTRYVYGELGGGALLGWETTADTTGSIGLPANPGNRYPRAGLNVSQRSPDPDELSPQEVAFFQGR